MAGWLSDNGLLLGLALLDGLAYAALVFMVAVGLNLVFGVLRIVNVAHGSVLKVRPDIRLATRLRAGNKFDKPRSPDC